MIMRSTIVPEAIALIDSKYETVQESAINALITLSDDETFADTFRDYGGFAHLAAVLEMGNEGIMMIGTKLLAKAVAKNGRVKLLEKLLTFSFKRKTRMLSVKKESLVRWQECYVSTTSS